LAKRKTPSARRGLAGTKPRARGSAGRVSSGLSRATFASLGEAVSGFLRSYRVELAALALTVLGVLSLAALLAPSGATVGGAWAGVVRSLFGWGSYGIAVLTAAAAAYFFALRLGARLPLPGLRRLAGGAILLAVVLAALHAAGGALDLDSGIALAQAGGGGGYFGAAILGGLVEAVGVAGGVLVLLGLTLAGLTLVLGVSFSEQVAAGWRMAGEAGGDLRNRRGGRRARQRRERPLPTTPFEAVPPSPNVITRPSAPVVGPPVEEEQDPAAASADVVETRLGVPATAHEPSWALPNLASILDRGAEARADEQFDRSRARMIEETLLAFGAPVRVVEINRGPTITQFGVEPDYTEGRGGRRMKVKVSKISALADDLALALSAPSIRIQAPVPGKGYVGIEVPNTEIQVVALRDVMEAQTFLKLDSRLRLGLGQDVSGHAVAANLSAMPHLLIAGTTGSGKSVCVNSIISCLLLQNTPDELRFVMIDPKRVELAPYNQVPHLLAPVVVELDRVVGALQWVSREMNDRYTKFSQSGARNIEEYNRRMQTAGQRRLPYLVLVIDELADLMMLAPDETEKAITRLAQLARATGIHLIIATQRPSVDVVTGLIKANFPARIAFAVASSVDSRVVLDQPGAERLLGRGDMLFQAPDSPAPVRMQGAFVSEVELTRLLQHWKGQAVERGVVTPPLAPSAMPGGLPMKQGALWEEEGAEDDGVDPLFDEAVDIVRRMRRASISLLQRRLRIGYTRSARLMDQLEERGIVGPAQSGSQAREVLKYGELQPEGEGRSAS
jgi:S-DNA-T family DNA segregation ATPase FtsK/SpoIIIE